MNVRVNLLPEATKQRDRASQQRAIAGLAGVLLLAILGGVYLWAQSEVNDAELELLAEQARTSELRGEEAELVAFEELAQRSEQADAVLVTALADEISFAGMLQDVAMVMPGDTQLETFAVDVPVETDPAATNTNVATLTMTGRTLTSHAPGVERVLLGLDKIASFRDVYFNSSTLDEEGERIATFALDAQIGPEALTGRYEEGLPEEWR